MCCMMAKSGGFSRKRADEWRIFSGLASGTEKATIDTYDMPETKNAERFCGLGMKSQPPTIKVRFALPKIRSYQYCLLLSQLTMSIQQSPISGVGEKLDWQFGNWNKNCKLNLRRRILYLLCP